MGLDGIRQDAGREAIDCVKSNPDAYVVCLHSDADGAKDDEVVRILEKYGIVFRRKDVRLTSNGCANLRKMSPGVFWRGAPGGMLLRVLAFVCDAPEKAARAKEEILALPGMGNFGAHVSDCHEEAVWLAETFFNDNTLELMNRRPSGYEDPAFDEKVHKLASLISERHLDREDFCCLATTIFGIRKSGDLDCFYLGDGKVDFFSDDISDNADEFSYYPFPPREILDDPKLHCYYRGLKFVALDVLLGIKRKRGKPRDKETCRMIECFKNGKKYRERHFRIYEKRKDGDKRKIILFGFIKINYRRRRKPCDIGT